MERKEGKILIEGVLKKWTNYVYRWKSRYCQFTDDGFFHYGKRKTSSLKGGFPIKKTVIKSIPSEPTRLVLSHKGEEIDLKANSLEEKTKWLQAFNAFETKFQKELEKDETSSDSSAKGTPGQGLLESGSDQESPSKQEMTKKTLDQAKFRNIQAVLEDMKKTSLKNFLRKKTMNNLNPVLWNVFETIVILQEKLLANFKGLLEFTTKKTGGINALQKTLLTVNSINVNPSLHEFTKNAGFLYFGVI